MPDAWVGHAKCILVEPHERLRYARQLAGLESASEAARRLDMELPTYLGHENGSRGWAHLASKYAAAYNVSLDWLLTGRGEPRIARRRKKYAVGYIGAGAEVRPIDDHAQGAGLEEVELPPGVPNDVIAVIVRGDSMFPRYMDGEFLFYAAEERPPDELLGRECVVRLSDGRMLVKTLRRGSQKGLFTLYSWNAPPLEDQAVEWASPVRGRS